MKRDLQLLVLVGAIVATGLMVSLWRITSGPPIITTAPPPSQPAVALPGPAAPPEPGTQHPLTVPTAPLTAGGLVPALIDLLGRKAVMSYLQLEEFPRRFVATVDNLGRSHAPPALWPVHPTPDRFTVEEHEGAAVIAADNRMRYEPFVLLVESVDASQAVALYVRAYPLLQRAYEQLGYPNRYFNDRLVAVIDQLLQTPERKYPLKVQLIEVKGPVPSVRPWVRYEYADPALESLSSGQKMLLRVGPENQRRLKAKLAAIRKELAAPR